MGPIWGRQDPGGPHVGPINFPIWVVICLAMSKYLIKHLLTIGPPETKFNEFSLKIQTFSINKTHLKMLYAG